MRAASTRPRSREALDETAGIEAQPVQAASLGTPNVAEAVLRRVSWASERILLGVALFTFLLCAGVGFSYRQEMQELLGPVSV